MEDLSLLEQIKRHDQEAMMTLYERHANLVFSIVYRVLGDDSLAEECVQDVFMKVWQSTSQYDPTRGPFIAWLIGISRNLAIDKLRQRTRQQNVNNTFSIDENENESSTFSNLPESLVSREQSDAIRIAIRFLPIEQIQVIELGYFGGLTQNEIAEYLSLPLGTVKTRMRLGMQKLREFWMGASS